MITLLPTVHTPMLSHTCMIASSPRALLTHQQLKHQEQQVKRQLALLTQTQTSLTTPTSITGAQPTGIQLHLRHGAGMSSMVVQQDLGMTPAPVDAEDEDDEEEVEEDGDAAGRGDLFEGADDGQEDFSGASVQADDDEEMGEYIEEDASGGGSAQTSGSGEMLDVNHATPQNASTEDEDQPTDPDAELDEMDPAHMTEEEQIRFLERQHEREVRAQQQQQQSASAQRGVAATPAQSTSTVEEDDFFASPSGDHITPPTRSQRSAGSSAVSSAVPPPAPRTGAILTRTNPVARQQARFDANVTPRMAPGTVRRTLDLDSSNDSTMQIDTPPRTVAAAAAASPSPHTPAASSSFAPAAPSSSQPAISVEMLAELGLPEEEIQAILAEQMLIFEQTRR